jgi:hypothetical protein
MAQGKSAGEAQAIVNGQEPKTLAGKTPEAKPTPTPQEPEAQRRCRASRANKRSYFQPSYVVPGVHDIMGINRNVWQNVMSEEGPGLVLITGILHFGLWQDASGLMEGRLLAVSSTAQSHLKLITDRYGRTKAILETIPTLKQPAQVYRN